MGRAYRDLFSATRLPQIYWKNLDLTVCKIANSDVDGGNSGIFLLTHKPDSGVLGGYMSAYPTCQAQGLQYKRWRLAEAIQRAIQPPHRLEISRAAAFTHRMASSEHFQMG
jgi:hypothetical protein